MSRVHFRDCIAAWFSLLFSIATAGELGTHHTIRYPKQPYVEALVYSPDGSQLALSLTQRFGRSRRGVDFIDVAAGRKTATHTRDAPFSMAYSKDEEIICMISQTRQVRLDTLTGTELPAKSASSQAAAKPGKVGIVFEEVSGKVLIKSLDEGSPAKDSGKINVGDELVGVADGRHRGFVNAIGMNVAGVKKWLAGDAGKEVRLRLLPKGVFDEDEATEVVLVRREKIWDGTVWRFKETEDIAIDENALWCIRGGYYEIVNAKTGQTIAKLQTVDIENGGKLVLSQDQKRCAFWAERKDDKGYAVEVFDIASQERIAFLPCVEESFYNLDFDATGDFVLVGTHQTVEVGNIEEQRFVGTLTLGWEPTEEDLAKEKESKAEYKRIMESQLPSLAIKAQAMRYAGYRPFNAKRAKHVLVRDKAVSSKNIMATVEAYGVTNLFDVHSGQLLAKVPTNKIEGMGYNRAGRVDVKFSPDGNWLSLYLEDMLHIIDVSEIEPNPDAERTGFMPYEFAREPAMPKPESRRLSPAQRLRRSPLRSTIP